MHRNEKEIEWPLCVGENCPRPDRIILRDERKIVYGIKSPFCSHCAKEKKKQLRQYDVEHGSNSKTKKKS